MGVEGEMHRIFPPVQFGAPLGAMGLIVGASHVCCQLGGLPNWALKPRRMAFITKNHDKESLYSLLFCGRGFGGPLSYVLSLRRISGGPS